MSTYETEFGLNEKVTVKSKPDAKVGIIREIILSSSGKKFTQEYGVEIIGADSYDFRHLNKGQIQAIV